jgi:hypothetical protein
MVLLRRTSALLAVVTLSGLGRFFAVIVQFCRSGQLGGGTECRGQHKAEKTI